VKQLICRIDGIKVVKVDGRDGPQTRYMIGM
jgi:hypothetical protein